MVEGGGGVVRAGEDDEVSPVDVLLPDLGVSLRHPAVDDSLSVCLSVEARPVCSVVITITMLLCAHTVSACAAWKETSEQGGGLARPACRWIGRSERGRGCGSRQ